MTINKKKNFVTLFPRCENVHLTKDVGMIPYTLYKYYNYNSIIVCYKNSDKYEYLDKEVKGLKIEHLEKKYKSERFNVFRYIVRNAKRIDILNVYHLNVKNQFLWCILYKMLNPRGEIYIKLDMNCMSIKEASTDKKLYFLLKRFFIRHAKVVSVESKEIQNDLEKIYKTKVYYIPNGCYPIDLKFSTKTLKKEKRILNIGRIGNSQKATDILMEAFRKTLDFHDWNLEFVGPIEEEFKDYIDNFFKRYPNAIGRIEFVGEIENKEMLKEKYESARIFALPSRIGEGFPLVLVEALSNGCYIITSDSVPPAQEVTNNQKFGSIAKTNDIDDLKNIILETIEKVNFDNKLSEDIRKYAYDNFNWKTICDKLDRMLNNK